MASAVKFLDFVEQLGLKQHNLNTDTLKIALSNTSPTNTNTTFAPGGAHPPPAAANGYTTGGHDILNTWSETSGTATLSGTDVTITATAGGIGPFRYIILYNDDNATDMLLQYYDHGSSITLADGEAYVFDILTNILTLA